MRLRFTMRNAAGARHLPEQLASFIGADSGCGEGVHLRILVALAYVARALGFRRRLTIAEERATAEQAAEAVDAARIHAELARHGLESAAAAKDVGDLYLHLIRSGSRS
jgi:hypothetical protein